MIYGLLAALGWGSADVAAAVAGRRIGALTTVLIGQGLSLVVTTAIFLIAGHGASSITPYLALVALDGVVSAGAYISHYHALQLGPVSVVSPISSTYAIVGVVLSVVVLGERPTPLMLLAGLVIIVGVGLVSTDLRRLEPGQIKSHPAGALWAIVAAVLFGIGGFLLGYLSIHLGWVTGLWASRSAQIAAFVAIALVQRPSLTRLQGHGAMVLLALGVGALDLLGVISFAIGADAGFLPVVLLASAVFPLVAVLASIVFLHERPVPNHYAGIAFVTGGLLLLRFA